MANQLPHNDPDAILARKIDEARDERRELSDLDDPLMAELLEYKSLRDEAYETNAEQKEKVWDDITSATKDRKNNGNTSIITNLITAKALRWAAAAVLVIGLIFGVVYEQYLQGPELLASSGNTMKTVRLSDGSTIKLRPHSKFYRIKNEANLKRYKLKGEGFFNITHNPARTFSVQASTGKVSVLGTQFNLSSWGNRLQVYLKKGSVKVKALESDSSVIIKPGESASVSGPKARPMVSQSSAETFMDWLHQKIIFHNQPAQKVAEELQQEFDIKITLPPKIAVQKITGSLSTQHLPSALDDLGLVLNGSFTKKGSSNYTFTINK